MDKLKPIILASIRDYPQYINRLHQTGQYPFGLKYGKKGIMNINERRNKLYNGLFNKNA